METDGGAYIAGSRSGLAVDEREDDTFVFRIDAAGALLWERAIGEPGILESVGAVVAAPDDGLLAVGSRRQSSRFEMFVIRIGPNGELPEVEP